MRVEQLDRSRRHELANSDKVVACRSSPDWRLALAVLKSAAKQSAPTNGREIALQNTKKTETKKKHTTNAWLK